MKNKPEALAVIASVFIAGALATGSVDAKPDAKLSLRLAVTPDCARDANGPLLPEIPRIDLKATFNVRVALSGLVEQIDLKSHEPTSVDVDGLWQRFAKCWKQKARYDTTGIAPAVFPVEHQLMVTWSSRDGVPRPDD